jgi:predicted AAA+ superfamily ATPase
MEYEMIKRNNYIERIKPFVNKDIIKVFVGFRRVGKSVLLRQVQDYLLENGCGLSQMVTLNFEDFRTFDYREPKALYEFLITRIEQNRKKTYLFLDEIQNVKGFEEVINSLRATEDVDIYITGSNAQLLSGELATLLAGRYVAVNVYPYSYSEFLQAKNIGVSPQSFQDYVLIGGLPFVVSGGLDGSEKDDYIESLYDSVILKDIIARNEVRNVDLLERITRYALDNIGTIISGNSLAKYLKSEGISVTTTTVLAYLHYLCDAMLLYPVRKYNLQGKPILKSQEKYYVVDHGLRESLLHTNTRDVQLILENIVAMEAIRRGYQVRVGGAGNYEIDFVLMKGEHKLYLQVTYLLAGPETVEREFRPFYQIKDNYRKIVLSTDSYLQPRDGIEHLNIADFLLEEKW